MASASFGVPVQGLEVCLILASNSTADQHLELPEACCWAPVQCMPSIHTFGFRDPFEPKTHQRRPVTSTASFPMSARAQRAHPRPGSCVAWMLSCTNLVLESVGVKVYWGLSLGLRGSTCFGQKSNEASKMPSPCAMPLQHVTGVVAVLPERH